jgi:hypothetical protein
LDSTSAGHPAVESLVHFEKSGSSIISLCLQVTLLSRFNGVGYTFVLAGFLKIMTVGGLSLSAPTDVARTAFGKATPYLMVPVGLGMCWIAKQVGEAGGSDGWKHQGRSQ